MATYAQFRMCIGHGRWRAYGQLEFFLSAGDRDQAISMHTGIYTGQIAGQ